MILFDRLLKIMTTPWMVLSYLACVGLSLAFVDKPLAVYLHNLEFGHFTLVLKAITVFGIAPAYFVILLGLLFILRYAHRNKLWEGRIWFLLLCLVISNTICLILKTSLGRARPDLFFTSDIFGFYGFQMHSAFWSFPSGHTTTVMTLAFVFCVLLPRLSYAYILLALMIVASRIMLGQHFLGDVMMASYLALLEVGLIRYWWQRKMTKFPVTSL